jgi:hypothetical protein
MDFSQLIDKNVASSWWDYYVKSFFGYLIIKSVFRPFEIKKQRTGRWLVLVDGDYRVEPVVV